MWLTSSPHLRANYVPVPGLPPLLRNLGDVVSKLTMMFQRLLVLRCEAVLLRRVLVHPSGTPLLPAGDVTLFNSRLRDSVYCKSYLELLGLPLRLTTSFVPQSCDSSLLNR